MTTKLSLYREDPDNVSTATDAEISRLAGKVRRNPRGLAAMRIAYVTDAPGGGRMVNTGNKRLRVLKQIAADGGLAVDGAWLISPAGEVPAEWFCDITFMTPEQRREFRLNTNISDGSFDAEKLLAQYTRDDLAALMSAEAIEELLGAADKDEYGTDFTLPDGEKSEYGQMTFVVTEKLYFQICGNHRREEDTRIYAYICLFHRPEVAQTSNRPAYPILPHRRDRRGNVQRRAHHPGGTPRGWCPREARKAHGKSSTD